MACAGETPAASSAGRLIRPPPPAIESINPASTATKNRTPTTQGATINQSIFLSVSLYVAKRYWRVIKERAYPAVPDRFSATVVALDRLQPKGQQSTNPFFFQSRYTWRSVIGALLKNVLIQQCLTGFRQRWWLFFH